MQCDTAGQPDVLPLALGLFATLLRQLETDVRLLLERGFPAVWLFTLLQARGLRFLVRRDVTQRWCRMWPLPMPLAAAS